MNELSVIVPVLSHADRVSAFLDSMGAFLMIHPGDIDVMVVFDQTVDSPETIIDHALRKFPWMRLRVLQRLGRGSIRNYGSLVRFALAHSTSQFAVLVSPYGDDDLTLLVPMLALVRDNVQLVQATRYENAGDRSRIPRKFRIYQSVYRMLVRMLLGRRISDSTYAFKMFDRIFIQSLGLTRNRFSLCPEITLKTVLASGKVAYLPSGVQPIEPVNDFRLGREGIGYLALIARGFLHRLGILWF